MHVSNVYTSISSSLQETSSLITSGNLPLLYAGAMLIDAIAALVFGYLYDKIGIKALMISTLLSSIFSIFIFSFNSINMLLIGLGLWGIGMGAQESILKAVVTKLIPKNNRASGYGIFEFSFGIFWFLGSWLMGILYDFNINIMVIVSVVAQLSAIIFYIISDKLNKVDK